MSINGTHLDIDSMCVKCRVGRALSHLEDRSTDFVFQGRKCHLFYKFTGAVHRLYFDGTGKFRYGACHDPAPFDAVTDVANCTARVRPELRRETHVEKEDSGYPLLWERTNDDVVRAFPEFGRDGGEKNNSELRFRVLLKTVKGDECTCATCQLTAGDDDASSLESLSNDLGNLLDKNATKDVEFRCVDADDNILATVKAHKFLVCARSPVLASILHSDTVEGRTGVATIRDMDADVFMQFLKYLYSGKLEETTVDMDTALSLYEAGDRFRDKSFAKLSAQRIVRNLTIENSCEILVLADARGDEELAEATLAFMVNREVPHVFDGWEDFCSRHPVLSTGVLNRFCKRFKRTSPEGESSCSELRRIETECRCCE